MALFDKAWARQTGGRFVLRIEDTDRNRLVPGSEEQIYETLDWLALGPDESPLLGGPYAPYKQSERLDSYRPYVDQLLADGHAYYCWCSQERLAALRKERADAHSPETGYDRLCLGMTKEERSKLPGFSETPVVRMRIPDDVELGFHDLIRGDVRAPRPDDQVILKADGFPTYHLAVVVDDHLMGIDTVVRGEEWISSTPKHLLLYKWLGWQAPQFAHMPLLRNTDKSKISKRKNPAARLMWFREQGYLPEALRNFLQLLAYPTIAEGEEMESFESFIQRFRWSDISTGGPVFDVTKLDWLNGQYIRSLDVGALADRVLEYAVASGQLTDPSEAAVARIRAGMPLVRERLTLLSEAVPKLSFLLVEDAGLAFDEDSVAKLKGDPAAILDAALATLEGLPEDGFDAETIQQALKSGVCEALGIKPRVGFAPIRVGVTGNRVSPPLFESMEILGRASCLARLRRFADQLAG
ncbi:MAG: glutamate--tRNA ligase [Acidipropionibacterium sp.]|jgi:glutamyl-tRNA synthetase|nr:glutamate--tRNA ligase [Acidipropionibacterium sp.]